MVWQPLIRTEVCPPDDEYGAESWKNHQDIPKMDDRYTRRSIRPHRPAALRGVAGRQRGPYLRDFHLRYVKSETVDEYVVRHRAPGTNERSGLL